MHRTIPDHLLYSPYFGHGATMSPSFFAYFCTFDDWPMCLPSVDYGKFDEGVSMKSGAPDDVTHCFSRALPLPLYI